MRVLFIASEGAPFVKVGGLGDVVGSLPKALKKLGHDVRIVMPGYGLIDAKDYSITTLVEKISISALEDREIFTLRVSTLEPDIPVYFIGNERYFGRAAVYGEPDDLDRFLFFCKAVMKLPETLDWQPEVFHCHDWETAIIPNWLRSKRQSDPFYRDSASLFTIHNLAYQGLFDHNYLVKAGLDDVYLQPLVYNRKPPYDLMSQGILYADVLNTVSETYAREVTTPLYGDGLESALHYRQGRFYGVVNGIDYAVFNPETDPELAANYGPDTLERRNTNKVTLQARAKLPRDADIPLIGFVSRLYSQKGSDLAVQALQSLLRKTDVQFVLLGVGEEKYERQVRQLAKEFPTKVAAFFSFDTSLGQLIYGSCDMFLMPSRYEPCGLGQLIALRYGAIPVVRRTGGLADTVQDYDPATGQGNGFVFEAYKPEALLDAIERALTVYGQKDTWIKLMRQAMACDYSWDASARKYEALYQRALTVMKSDQQEISNRQFNL